MSECWRSGPAVLAALAIGFCLPATEARAGDWQWMIAPYLWGSDISVDMQINDEPVIGGDVGFSDILDKTELAAMLHFEGSPGKAGFFVDLLFLSVSDNRTTPAHPPLPGGTMIALDLETGIYEAAGFYRLLDDGQALDVIFGTRLIDMDLQTDFTLPGPMGQSTTVRTSKTYVDGMLGLRYGRPFAGRWDFAIRGDASTGDTEVSWNGVATAGVRLGKSDRYGLRVGWRYLLIELEDQPSSGVTVENELTMSGPAVAFTFSF